MGSLLKTGAVAYGIKEVVARIQKTRKPKRNNFLRFGVPALAGTAVAGGLTYLGVTGKLKPLVDASKSLVDVGKGAAEAAKDEAEQSTS